MNILANQVSPAWLSIRDFNQILDLKDKSSRNDGTPGAEDFQAFLAKVKLIDVILQTNWYTWTNNWKGE